MACRSPLCSLELGLCLLLLLLFYLVKRKEFTATTAEAAAAAATTELNRRVESIWARVRAETRFTLLVQWCRAITIIRERKKERKTEREKGLTTLFFLADGSSSKQNELPPTHKMVLLPWHHSLPIADNSNSTDVHNNVSAVSTENKSSGSSSGSNRL